MSPSIGRVVTAMVTPFDERGDLDLDAAVELANWLVENGSDGLVLAGTTGESPTLTESEELVLFRTVAEAVSVPVVAGAGSNATASAVEQTRRATETGVDAILSVVPYYNRPSQEGLEGHFRAVAAATNLPVIIYDIPARTGRKLATETVVRLAHEVPNIVGLKDAAGLPGETARLLSLTPDGFEVYAGDDPLTLPLMAIGAVGVISVASHWVGRQQGEMIERFLAGDLDGARRINEGLLHSYAFQSSDDAPNPIPTKALLRVLGLKVGECRPPMGPAPDWVTERARVVLEELN